MTLLEYKQKCVAAMISNPFLDKANLQLLDATLFTDMVCGMLEMTIPYTREDLELADSDTNEISLAQLRTIVIRRTNTAYYLNADRWNLKFKALTALHGLTVAELGSNWSRIRDVEGSKAGNTGTTGSASRNSYNTSALVPVSGSHVSADSEEEYTESVTESGIQGNSKEANIMNFMNSMEFQDLMQDMTNTFVAAVAISVY